MEIKVGDYEVYQNGTIIGNIGEPVIFKIEDLVYEFHFIENKEIPEQKIDMKSNTGKSIIIEFSNFNNTLGSGNRVPVKLGIINDKNLYLNFRVYALGDGAGKMLHYTWLTKREEGVQNGK